MQTYTESGFKSINYILACYVITLENMRGFVENTE